MFKYFLILILKNIRYRPVRSWLTILGVIIGIMLVVIIMALSDGIKGAVARSLQMFGSDILLIRPGKATNPIETIASLLGGQKFRDEDLAALSKINGVRFVAPMDAAFLTIEFSGEQKSSMLHGAPWKEYRIIYEESQGFRLLKGRWPDNDDVNEVVIGYRVSQNLFKTKVDVGDEIIVKSKKLKVIGILSGIGEQMADNVVYLSLKVFRELTGLRTGVISAAVKIKPGFDMNLIAKQIEFQLSQQKAVTEFSTLTPEKAANIIGNVLSIIEAVLLIIALVSLLVGAVGIMNTMYTSVLERIKQIGIMKAIGASRDSILSLFLIESGMIGLIGGVLGILFGIFASYVIGAVAGGFGIKGLFTFASLDFFGFLALLVFTFLVGIVAGILPARQAAHLEPAEALRYE